MAGRLSHGRVVAIQALLRAAVQAVERLAGDGGAPPPPDDLVTHHVPVDGNLDRPRSEPRCPGLIQAHAARAVVLRREDVAWDRRRSDDAPDARVIDVLELCELDLARKGALEQLAPQLDDDRVEDERAAADTG